MGMDSSEFLISAENIMAEPAIKKEIDARNAASRAYYTAYHVCNEFGNNLLSYRDVPGGVHARLIDTLESYRDKSVPPERQRAVKALGYQLRQIRSLRISADYLLSDDFPDEHGLTTIKLTKRIQDKVESLSKSDAA